MGPKRGVPPMKLHLTPSNASASSMLSSSGSRTSIAGLNANGDLTLKGDKTITRHGAEVKGKRYELTMDDLTIEGELGKGQYGTVYKAYHKKMGKHIALKQIHLMSDEKTCEQIGMELEVLTGSNSPYIVDFYGSFVQETQVYYAMEYMDGGSLDKLYDGGVPEPILAKIAFSMVSGLHYMKEQLSKIHRDVKPTNVLVNSKGEIKLCDFGVSGQLVQSLARTYVGCQHYMAPERINVTPAMENGYGVVSDVWSLGLSLVEVAVGKFPYGEFDSVFSQLNAIVNGETPRLPADRFSEDAVDFCLQCMLKDYSKRPSYPELLQHKFIQRYADVYVDVASWVRDGTMRHEAKKGKAPMLPLTEAAATNYIIDRPPPSSLTSVFMQDTRRVDSSASISDTTSAGGSVGSLSSDSMAVAVSTVTRTPPPILTVPSNSKSHGPATLDSLPVNTGPGQPMRKAPPAPTAYSIPAPDMTKLSLTDDSNSLKGSMTAAPVFQRRGSASSSSSASSTQEESSSTEPETSQTPGRDRPGQSLSGSLIESCMPM